MNYRFRVLAMLVAVVGFGFVAASASAQLSITEVSSNNSLGEDWFEITNTSGSTVALDGFFWDDDGPAGDDGAVFGNFSIAAGESLIVLEGDATTEVTFRDIFSLNSAIQVLTEEDFTGNDTFSGLSSNGDEISLFDTDPNVAGANFNLIDFVEFPGNTGVSSFDFTQLNPDGTPTLSVAGVNGAITASNGDVGSPGSISAVPEPGAIALLTMLGTLLSFKRRRQI